MGDGRDRPAAGSVPLPGQQKRGPQVDGHRRHPVRGQMHQGEHHRAADHGGHDPEPRAAGRTAPAGTTPPRPPPPPAPAQPPPPRPAGRPPAPPPPPAPATPTSPSPSGSLHPSGARAAAVAAGRRAPPAPGPAAPDSRRRAAAPPPATLPGRVVRAGTANPPATTTQPAGAVDNRPAPPGRVGYPPPPGDPAPDRVGEARPRRGLGVGHPATWKAAWVRTRGSKGAWSAATNSTWTTCWPGGSWGRRWRRP